MTYDDPAMHLDEINQLRVAKQVREVDELAEAIWAAWSSRGCVPPAGMAAVCQVAFISSFDARAEGESDVLAKAQLWRARASSAAVQTGELNAMAMLMIPLAFQAGALGHHATAIAITHEIGRLVDEFERRETVRRDACDRDGSEFRRAPGVPLAVLRRAQHEKAAYLFWRCGDYEESLSAYGRAREFASPRTRDWVRLDGGELLAQLGVDEESTGAFDSDVAGRAFLALADEAKAGGWLDVEIPMRRNGEAVRRGETSTVQALEPIELE